MMLANNMPRWGKFTLWDYLCRTMATLLVGFMLLAQSATQLPPDQPFFGPESWRLCRFSQSLLNRPSFQFCWWARWPAWPWSESLDKSLLVVPYIDRPTLLCAGLEDWWADSPQKPTLSSGRLECSRRRSRGGHEESGRGLYRVRTIQMSAASSPTIIPALLAEPLRLWNNVQNVNIWVGTLRRQVAAWRGSAGWEGRVKHG